MDSPFISFQVPKFKKYTVEKVSRYPVYELPDSPSSCLSGNKYQFFVCLSDVKYTSHLYLRILFLFL